MSEELVITRVFDAPCDQVWLAWLEPERLKQWFAPRGSTITSFEVLPDPRLGGRSKFNYRLRTPEGRDMWGSWVVHGRGPHALSFHVSLSDEQGGTGVHSVPRFIEVTALGKWTELTLRWGRRDASEVERKAFDEWAGTLDHLAAYMARDPQVS